LENLKKQIKFLKLYQYSVSAIPMMTYQKLFILLTLKSIYLLIRSSQMK